MTPLLPNPDYYLHNLITMTSSDSKRLWRTLIVNAFIAENFMNYTTLQSTMYDLNVEVVQIQRRMLYPRVDDAIRTKVVENG